MVADKENTYHKTQKPKPKPKTETQIPKRKHKVKTRITKYKIESYNLKKNWKFYLVRVIQNKHSKPGNRCAKA